MINDLENFKKQCGEYNNFIKNIKQITKDFCSFFEKENPYEKSSSTPKFEIDEDFINLSYIKKEYCCGEQTIDYFDLKIPLDFYDNLSDYQILKENIKAELKSKNEELKSLNSKKSTLDFSIRTIQSEIWKIEEINKKHEIQLDTKELKYKKRELEKESEELTLPIKKLNKEIKILKEKI